MHFVAADDSEFVPASHENPSAPGVLKRVIAGDAMFQFGQVRMLNWARLPVGASFRPHYHEDMQEAFVLVKGHVRMRGGDQFVMMQPGDTVLVPPGEIHQMRNEGSEVAEYLVFGISSGENGRTIVVDEFSEHSDNTHSLET